MSLQRVLVVHHSSSVRAQLRDVLDRAGFATETVTSTYRCMARAVAEPADLVVLGLAELAEVELDVITALKAEPKPPRILVAFAANRREMAVKALEAGADAYLLEPFYGAEVRRVAAGILGAPPAPAPAAPEASPLRSLAHEVAHAVNNPLQIVRLLLDKKNVTKKQLEEDLPPQIDRIDQVVGMLREYGAFPDASPTRGDTGPHVRLAAKNANVLVEGDADAHARIDGDHFAGALTAMFRALRERAGEDAELTARVQSDGDEVTVSVAVDARAFGDDDVSKLRETVFVVGADRDIRHGLALANALMEEQGGTLSIGREGARLVFRATVPAA